MSTFHHFRFRVGPLAVSAIAAMSLLAACGSDDATSSSSAAPSTAAATPTTEVTASTAATTTETPAADTPTTDTPTTDTPTTDTPSTETPGTDGTTTSAHAGHDGPAVTVDAIDYKFENLPASIEAGTILSLHNKSTAELHELVAFRLADNETRPVDVLAQLPEADLLQVLGPVPATVLIAPPGADSFPVVGDGALTEPGRYVVFCAIPVGANPEEYLAAAQTSDGPPQVAGGAPHFTQGMYADIIVE
jgi:hypothetical protein